MQQITWNGYIMKHISRVYVYATQLYPIIATQNITATGKEQKNQRNAASLATL